MPFSEIEPGALADNPFTLIGSDWMLITAGTPEQFNTMTASWGGLGILWERKVCFIFIRPTRYTYEFIERTDTYTLSFFAEQHRKALLFCGTHSGRDTNKAKATGLTPAGDGNIVFFNEARTVLVCRKIYTDDIDPARFLDPAIATLYPRKDYHRMYVGEIVKCLAKRS